MVLNQSPAFQPLSSTVGVFQERVQITLSPLIVPGIRTVPYFTKQQAVQDTSILLDHLMVLALVVNSEKSSLTRGGSHSSLKRG